MTNPSNNPVSVEVPAFSCRACDHLFQFPDGPLYECSRCSGRQAGEGENRCEECHIFMSKLSDSCCPECQAEGDELDSITAWLGTDGNLYISADGEQAWLAGAAQRELDQARSRAELDTWIAERRVVDLARNARLLPRLRQLLALLGDHCPQLRGTITYNIEDDPACSGRVTAYLYFNEMAELFAPDLRTELMTAGSYVLPYAAKRPAETTIRDRIVSQLPPSLTERMSGDMFGVGSGIGFEMEVAANGLLEALVTP